MRGIFVSLTEREEGEVSFLSFQRILLQCGLFYSYSIELWKLFCVSHFSSLFCKYINNIPVLFLNPLSTTRLAVVRDKSVDSHVPMYQKSKLANPSFQFYRPPCEGIFHECLLLEICVARTGVCVIMFLGSVVDTSSGYFCAILRPEICKRYMEPIECEMEFATTVGSHWMSRLRSALLGTVKI